MKCNKRTSIRIQNLFLFVFVIIFIVFLRYTVHAQEGNFPLRVPTESEDINNQEGNLPSSLEIKNLPHFPQNLFKKSAPHRISATATTIPMDTRLRLLVDNLIDAKTSMVGDYFKGHILEDFYIPTEPPQLVIPKGSWVRGRVSFIKKPTIFSKAGKIGLYLDQLTTPFGEVTPLDAQLDVQQGIVNEQGLLDPMTNYGTKALEPTQKLLETTQGKAISVIGLGTPVIGALVTGSLIALFSQGDNIMLNQGQELQIVLKKDIQLTVN